MARDQVRNWTLEDFSGGLDTRPGYMNRGNALATLDNGLVTKGRRIMRRPPMKQMDGSLDSDDRGFLYDDGKLYVIARLGDTITHTEDIDDNVDILYFTPHYGSTATTFVVHECGVANGVPWAIISHNLSTLLHVWDNKSYVPTYTSDPYWPNRFAPHGMIDGLPNGWLSAEATSHIYRAAVAVSKLHVSDPRGDVHYSQTGNLRNWNPLTATELAEFGESWVLSTFHEHPTYGGSLTDTLILERPHGWLDVDKRCVYYIMEVRVTAALISTASMPKEMIDTWVPLATSKQVTAAPASDYQWRVSAVTSRFSGGYDEIKLEYYRNTAGALYSLSRFRFVAGSTGPQYVGPPPTIYHRYDEGESESKVMWSEFRVSYRGYINASTGLWVEPHEVLVEGTDASADESYDPDTVAAYAAGTRYAKNDFVSYGGSYYRSKFNLNKGHQPDTSANWWEDLGSAVVTGISLTSEKTNLVVYDAQSESVVVLNETDDGFPLGSIREKYIILARLVVDSDGVVDEDESENPYVYGFESSSQWYADREAEYAQMAGASDAGILPTAAHNPDGDQITGIINLGKNLVVTYPENTQLWHVDVDPSNNRNLECLASGTGDPISSNDRRTGASFFDTVVTPTEDSFRQLALRGMDLDSFLDKGAGNALDGIGMSDVRACCFWPHLGAFVALGVVGGYQRFYVLRGCAGEKWVAWQRWTVAGLPVLTRAYLIPVGDRLYLRDDGSTDLWYFDASAGAGEWIDFDDDAGDAYTTEIATYLNDQRAPARLKRYLALDIASTGKVSVFLRMAPEGLPREPHDGPEWDGPVVEGFTYGHPSIPIHAVGQSIAFRITSQDEDGMELHALGLDYLTLRR
jgi:hypothetical protein